MVAADPIRRPPRRHPSRGRALVPSNISYEEYHPYGTTAWWTDPGSTVSQKRYRYTGKEKDEESGLYYHGARYYAPWLGRWTSSDPIGLGDGPNRFAYVHANPISHYDPTGTNDFEAYQRRNESPPAASWPPQTLPQEDDQPAFTNPSSNAEFESRYRSLVGDPPSSQAFRAASAKGEPFQMTLELERADYLWRKGLEDAQTQAADLVAKHEDVVLRVVEEFAGWLLTEAEAAGPPSNQPIQMTHLRLGYMTPEAHEVAEATLRVLNNLNSQGTSFVLQYMRTPQQELGAASPELTRVMLGNVMHRGLERELRGSQLVIFVGTGSQPVDTLGLQVNPILGRVQGIELTTQNPTTVWEHSQRPGVDTIVGYGLSQTLVVDIHRELQLITGIRNYRELQEAAAVRRAGRAASAPSRTGPRK